MPTLLASKVICTRSSPLTASVSNGSNLIRIAAHTQPHVKFKGCIDRKHQIREIEGEGQRGWCVK